MNAATRPRQVLVIRDGDPAALQHPPREIFDGCGAVTYVHVSSFPPLPTASHYVFHCEKLDERFHSVVAAAVQSRSIVTLIVPTVGRALTHLVTQERVNVIPSYGITGRLTPATLRRTLAAADDGQPVRPPGFIGVATDLRQRRRHLVLDLLAEASNAASESVPVAAGVLALQRSGSKCLHDLIGLTAGSSVRVFHEHEVPPPSELRADPRRALFDQVILESDAKRRQGLRQAIVRDRILAAERRYVFVSEREPTTRLLSHFHVRHRALLQSHYDPASDGFSNWLDIQRTFDQWAHAEVQRLARWYKRHLLEALGLNILTTTAVADGLFLGRHHTDTLVVVPTARLDELRQALESAYGAETYAAVSSNSAATRGYEAADRAFRRRVRFDPAVLDALTRIPEVLHIHGGAGVPST